MFNQTNNNIGKQFNTDASGNQGTFVIGDNNEIENGITDVDDLANRLIAVIGAEKISANKKQEILSNVEEMRTEVKANPKTWAWWKGKLEALANGAQIAGLFLQVLQAFVL